MSSTTIKLSFCVAATGHDLHLTVTLDDVLIWHGCPAAEPTEVVHEFDDSQDGEHTLVFEMQGKLSEHTRLGDMGEIVQDRYITVQDIAFDGIALGYAFTEASKYHHDTNGTTDPIQDRFFGVMGCNGRVEMRFSTPIYLWLLENI